MRATSGNAAVRFDRGFLPGITKFAGGPYDRASDPSVAYDAAHRVWLISSLALVEGPLRGAASWSAGRATASIGSRRLRFPTRPGRLTSTRTGPCATTIPQARLDGHCYTQFDNFAQADRIEMSTSVDGGLTWSAPAETADHVSASGVSRSSSRTGP